MWRILYGGAYFRSLSFERCNGRQDLGFLAFGDWGLGLRIHSDASVVGSNYVFLLNASVAWVLRVFLCLRFGVRDEALMQQTI